MRSALIGDSLARENATRGRSATMTRTCPTSATAARACAETVGATARDCAGNGDAANAIQPATSASTILAFILHSPCCPAADASTRGAAPVPCAGHRSEEHTSELQSLMRISYAVFCL